MIHDAHGFGSLKDPVRHSCYGISPWYQPIEEGRIPREPPAVGDQYFLDPQADPKFSFVADINSTEQRVIPERHEVASPRFPPSGPSFSSLLQQLYHNNENSVEAGRLL